NAKAICSSLNADFFMAISLVASGDLHDGLNDRLFLIIREHIFGGWVSQAPMMLPTRKLLTSKVHFADDFPRVYRERVGHIRWSFRRRVDYRQVNRELLSLPIGMILLIRAAVIVSAFWQRDGVQPFFAHASWTDHK
ncbi:MAG TPA: hypothetical protein VGN12_25515, partial [Pirellulales bacterium]